MILFSLTLLLPAPFVSSAAISPSFYLSLTFVSHYILSFSHLSPFSFSLNSLTSGSLYRPFGPSMITSVEPDNLFPLTSFMRFFFLCPPPPSPFLFCSSSPSFIHFHFPFSFRNFWLPHVCLFYLLVFLPSVVLASYLFLFSRHFSFFPLSSLLFRCAVASLYEVVSVRPLVRPSVRRSVPSYFQTRTRRILCRVSGLVLLTSFFFYHLPSPFGH